MAFSKGKYHFNKETKVETLYRPDKSTVVAQRTVTESPTATSKE
jgi:hypothetical protein